MVDGLFGVHALAMSVQRYGDVRMHWQNRRFVGAVCRNERIHYYT